MLGWRIHLSKWQSPTFIAGFFKSETQTARYVTTKIDLVEPGKTSTIGKFNNAIMRRKFTDSGWRRVRNGQSCAKRLTHISQNVAKPMARAENFEPQRRRGTKVKPNQRVKVISTFPGVKHRTVHCEDCDFAVDGVANEGGMAMFSQGRKHAETTGHTVWAEVTQEWRIAPEVKSGD